MKKAKRKHDYWRVVIVYTDNETSGDRVFSNLDRANRWAARQEKSKVVKKCKIEPFTREPYRWRDRKFAGSLLHGRCT
jgi:hypothetical protein